MSLRSRNCLTDRTVRKSPNRCQHVYATHMFRFFLYKIIIPSILKGFNEYSYRFVAVIGRNFDLPHQTVTELIRITRLIIQTFAICIFASSESRIFFPSWATHMYIIDHESPKLQSFKDGLESIRTGDAGISVWRHLRRTRADDWGNFYEERM